MSQGLSNLCNIIGIIYVLKHLWVFILLFINCILLYSFKLGIDNIHNYKNMSFLYRKNKKLNYLFYIYQNIYK